MDEVNLKVNIKNLDGLKKLLTRVEELSEQLKNAVDELEKIELEVEI
ncbi:hypothetical protein [Pseudolactococcus insecticola]|uniref:Uncharacterized protein n=1 Tax=Pseudolactococcus insecticola TaxID=2709158 RepID=A0A6A0B3U1_9LACT|nr:hypothetical protein [Lactococcus insecticola]GFH39822.1 hypothetical protein Hs20B_02200 [Lactococcus insecticola]